jgi:benzodiazapine receptor
MSTRHIVKLGASIFLCELAGFLGSLATQPSIPVWYKGLVKPSFTPPNGVFAPVWITLYFLMAIALFLVWRRGRKSPGVPAGLVLFFIQLGLNVLWAWVFFGWHRQGLGFGVIVLLWFFILLSLLKFASISRAAGWLLTPYLAWVTFAAVLNFSIWRLNG